MGKKFRGSRLVKWGLSQELVARFIDFCEAKDGSPAYRQLENAIEHYIDMADDGIKAKMEIAKKRRLNQ